MGPNVARLPTSAGTGGAGRGAMPLLQLCQPGRWLIESAAAPSDRRERPSRRLVRSPSHFGSPALDCGCLHSHSHSPVSITPEACSAARGCSFASRQGANGCAPLLCHAFTACLCHMPQSTASPKIRRIACIYAAAVVLIVG